jgi:beta-glucanase (GH16 family)
MKRIFTWLASVSVCLLLVSTPSEAIDAFATVRPMAPVITSVERPSVYSLTVVYRIDSAYKKKVRSVQFSINGGKTWKTTKSSPIKIYGLKPSTSYQFRLRQTATNGRVTVVKRTLKTSALPPANPVVTIPGFTVQDLLWSDEFNTGSTIDSSNWTARYCGHAASNGGGTCHNNESQYYIPSAIAVNNLGSAVITTTRVYSSPPVGACYGSSCGYTSGRFDTQGKVTFQYGYIESRIKMPEGDGNWPAFWMLGADITSVSWPRSGEMDIAEQGRDYLNRNSAALHYSLTNSGGGQHVYEYGETFMDEDLSADFHTYGLAWTPDQMTLYIDRLAFWTVSRQTIQSEFWPGNKPYFLILNNAIGPREGGFGGPWGDWTTSQMHIDYVRVYKLDGYGQVFK